MDQSTRGSLHNDTDCHEKRCGLQKENFLLILILKTRVLLRFTTVLIFARNVRTVSNVRALLALYFNRLLPFRLVSVQDGARLIPYEGIKVLQIGHF